MNNLKQITKIGIPRAISYYNNYPFYYGFFDALDVEIVLSDKTTSSIINDGSKFVVSETCFPIKVYVGHVINLLNKGIDTIFIPSIQSVAHKINNCSKIRGLPEIIRNVINREFTMIEPTLDKTENIGLNEFCFQTANTIGIFDKNKIKNAIKKGWACYNKFLEKAKEGYSFESAVNYATKGTDITYAKKKSYIASVVVMAHGYNLFDERTSLNLLKKLEKMNIRVYTGLNVSMKDSEKAIQELGEYRYWANELDLTGAAAYYMQKNRIDGIIALSAFGCGPDSLMVDEISYHCSEKNLPIIHLIIDEHTGEAGFVTRLEAFVDMLVRKKRLKHSKQNTKILNYKKTYETKKEEESVSLG